MPEISVIMPVYNQERYVAAAVRSILAQTFADFEFIVVDDGSTDRTRDVLKSFDDPRLRVIEAAHAGFLGALRTATAAASGRWLARMDSDDLVPPDRFARQLAFLRAHPECVFVSSAYGIVTPNDRFLAPAGGDGWCYVEPRDITLSTRLFCDSATVFSRAAAVEAGYDDEWENEKPLWYKLLRRGRGALLDAPLYYARWRMGSHSRGQAANVAATNYAIRLKYDRANAAPAAPRTASARPAIKNEKRCVYFNAAAGDYAAARATALGLWRQYPLSAETLKLLLVALGVRRPKSVEGPCKVRFAPAKVTWDFGF